MRTIDRFRSNQDPCRLDPRSVQDIRAGWTADWKSHGGGERGRGTVDVEWIAEGGGGRAGRDSSVVAEISVSTRCNQRTTPIAAIPAPFRPLRQLHPRVTHWRGTLNSVSLPLDPGRSFPPSAVPRVLHSPARRSPPSFSFLRGRQPARTIRTSSQRQPRGTILSVVSPFSTPFLPRLTTRAGVSFLARRSRTLYDPAPGNEND